ncbi:hypothetical protein EV189_0472 [Motilibacter rhizosphaerae]|uniref:Uncharacterized protein n=1 Tax=Motilibacter rhizosphaerae TaxID=598652 RepID=A0A4Q7NVL9_9ACTN|nr:DLW-39 family protein [Motilibacter rhizosphaerae]RZS91237.1 hypothetical protein EV189_0472 [Motilibacter rhizosphaerae]
MRRLVLFGAAGAAGALTAAAATAWRRAHAGKADDELWRSVTDPV